MGKSQFSKFLVIALALTAFLAGYLMIGGGFGGSPRNITGTVLDKFENQDSTADNKLGTESSTEPVLLADRQVVSLTTSRNNESVFYYEKNTGKVFNLDLAGKEERIVSDAVMANFMSSIWSPTREEVISSFYSQSGSDLRHYSFNTREITKLDPNIRSIAFSPDGDLTVYYYFDGQPITPIQSINPITEEISEEGPPAILVGKIMISEPSGQYQKKIIDTRLRDVEVSWPAKNQIVLKTPLFDLFLLTEDGKLNKFLESKQLLNESWSKSGKKLLYSALDETGLEPMLYIKNVETREEKPLSLAGTGSKCAWSIDDITIFCALAKSPSVDDIYKINILDGSRKLVAEPGFVVKDILLSSLESYLVFVSAVDEKLYGVRLSD